MNVETILRDKGDWVATIRPDATIADAVDMLNRERIGALVVSDDGADVAGMLSERDIVMALGRYGPDLLSHPERAEGPSAISSCNSPSPCPSPRTRGEGTQSIDRASRRPNVLGRCHRSPSPRTRGEGRGEGLSMRVSPACCRAPR